MTALYHGISTRDAAMLIGVPEPTIRQWLRRGHIQRTTDGRIDPFTLQDWWDYRRSSRGNRSEEHAARHNPYATTSTDGLC